MTITNGIISFIKDSFKSSFRGSFVYKLWLMFLLVVIAIGAYGYFIQLKDGLAVTAMNDYVSWGFYISNFTFLVGLAAASVMLVLPAYVLKDVDFSKAVILGEGVAVSALIMSLSFVLIDLGRIDRIWHMIPVLGMFNWPDSMLTWDVLVLNGYLFLNIIIPFYILYSHYKDKKPKKYFYVPLVFISVFWAISIHLVTAFLYAGLPARPYWNSAILGPRFLASAFAAGPAFIIVLLSIIKSRTSYPINKNVIDKLALITTAAAQINLVMLGSELFKEFYHATEHSHTAYYLYAGLHGHGALVEWIWTSIAVNIAATFCLSIHPLRRNHTYLRIICIVLFLAIWMEKGMGLIVPGFIPSPLGEVVEYVPNHIELMVTAGVWAMGLLILSLLLKAAIAVETGEIKFNKSVID